MIKIFRTILKFTKFFLIFQLVFRILRRYFKFPAPAFFGHVLDSDHRRKLQPPALIIERSGIKPGMQVLEVGCGSGAFTVSVARAVGSHGQVYALDIQSEMLAQLQTKLDRPENQDIHNIELVNKTAYSLPFEDGVIDLVYMVTVFQEIPDKPKCLNEITRVLKPGGFLSISEFLPDPDYPWMSTTARMGLKAGFVVDRMEGNLWNYTVRFRKNEVYR